MSTPWVRILGGASLAAAAAAFTGAQAAVLTLSIPPYPPKTVTYNQCASFTFNGSTLTCVPATTSTPPPTGTPPPPSSGTPFAGCPGDALMIDGAWGNNSINTFDYGYFGPNILSLRIVVPAGASTSKTTSWVEYGTAPFARDAVLSTVACDFSNTYALKKGSGQAARSAPDTMRFSFNYTTGAPSMFSVHVEPGQVYYLNVRNRFSDGSLRIRDNPSCQ